MQHRTSHQNVTFPF